VANGGGDPQTTVHQMGVTSGTFHFHYDAFGIVDTFDVFYEGNPIFTTGGPIQNAHDTNVSFGPGQATVIVVRVSPGSTISNWTYTVSCPA